MTTSIKSQITDLIDELSRAYSSKDVDAAAALFSDDVILVGTGADEVRFGKAALREQLTRDLTQADSIDLTHSDLQVTGSSDLASFYAAITAKAEVGGQTMEMPIRMTATATRRGTDWRIIEAHMSVALADQEAGQSFAPSA